MSAVTAGGQPGRVPAPAVAAAPGADDGRDFLSHAEMNRAYDVGEAASLAQSVLWLARYHGAWWILYEHGWLRITCPATEADLDQAAARLADARQAPGRPSDIIGGMLGTPSTRQSPGTF